jgi:biotin transport system substrate-specific component
MDLLLDYVGRLKTARVEVLARRDAMSLTSKIVLALVFAAMTGVAAQIRIPIPFSPVPITGQTFAVLAAGVLLGRNFGGFSMASYVALGAAGIPWFNGGGAGLSVLAGPTGGYMLGFIAAAMIIGHVFDKYVAARGFLPTLGIMLSVNFLVIHGLGLAWLGIYLTAIKGAAVSLPALFAMGTAPFIVGDIAKAAAAAMMAKTVATKDTPG